MQLISGFVDTYLRLSSEEEKQFNVSAPLDVEPELGKIKPDEQQTVMQIVTSWLEEGLQQGLQQGKQEGELVLILRQLTRRVGPVEPELQARIRELSITQLEDLGEALLDFANPTDLAAWLDKHQ